MYSHFLGYNVLIDEINDWKPLTTEHIKGGDKGVQQAGAVIALRKEGTPGDDHRFIQCKKPLRIFVV